MWKEKNIFKNFPISHSTGWKSENGRASTYETRDYCCHGFSIKPPIIVSVTACKCWVLAWILQTLL